MSICLRARNVICFFHRFLLKETVLFLHCPVFLHPLIYPMGMSLPFGSAALLEFIEGCWHVRYVPVLLRTMIACCISATRKNTVDHSYSTKLLRGTTRKRGFFKPKLSFPMPLYWFNIQSHHFYRYFTVSRRYLNLAQAPISKTLLKTIR